MLGIDVGGTDVKLGLVDFQGTIRQTHRTSTPELGTPQRVFEYAMEFANGELHRVGRPGCRLAGVGLAVPGVLDSRDFVLREVVNLPGWLEVPLLEILSRVSGLPSAVVNDANSAAYAEHSLRDLGDQSLALVTLGTGIGCGVVLKGSPYGGDHGCAGELGHIAIEFGEDALTCTCGSRGHLESYAGAAGVIAPCGSPSPATMIRGFRHTFLRIRSLPATLPKGPKPATRFARSLWMIRPDLWGRRLV